MSWEKVGDVKNLLPVSDHKALIAAQKLSCTPMAQGRVYILGAGPGDPELLTLKAYRLLQEADVVFYDALVSDAILNYLPTSCRRVYVGKRVGCHSASQTEIGERMIASARAGACVVRLKGGDPSLFARVNEEAKALTAAGIAFAIVPGITSACAAGAYAGIPLTARGSAPGVTFLTASFADPSREALVPKFLEPAHVNPTLVIYMGLGKLSCLCDALGNANWPEDTPIALLDKLSCDDQTQVIGTLNTIRERSTQEKLKGPTLIIVGEVVREPMAIQTVLLQASLAAAG